MGYLITKVSAVGTKRHPAKYGAIRVFPEGSLAFSFPFTVIH